MITVLDIWNRALAAIGHDRFIGNVDSPFIEAVHCRMEWDAARKSVLTAHRWGWLVLEVPICDGTETTDTATGKTVYIYPRPSGALRIVSVTDEEGSRVNWKAVNAQIEAEVDPVKISYLPDAEDPDDWPATVQDAIVAELAARIAVPVRKDARTADNMRRTAIAALDLARQRDAQEEEYDGEPDTRYTDSRR